MLRFFDHFKLDTASGFQIWMGSFSKKLKMFFDLVTDVTWSQLLIVKILQFWLLEYIWIFEKSSICLHFTIFP